MMLVLGFSLPTLDKASFSYQAILNIYFMLFYTICFFPKLVQHCTFKRKHYSALTASTFDVMSEVVSILGQAQVSICDTATINSWFLIVTRTLLVSFELPFDSWMKSTTTHYIIINILLEIWKEVIPLLFSYSYSSFASHIVTKIGVLMLLKVHGM